MLYARRGEAAEAHPSKYWFQSALARGLIAQGKIDEGLARLATAQALRPDEKGIPIEAIRDAIASQAGLNPEHPVEPLASEMEGAEKLASERFTTEAWNRRK